MKKKVSFLLVVTSILIILITLNCKSIATYHCYGENTATFDNSSFSNSKVYCWHCGQMFNGGGTYKLQYKYVIGKDKMDVYIGDNTVPSATYNSDNNKYSFFQGIAYIGYEGKMQGRSASNVSADKYQRAMWEYLRLNNNYDGYENQGTYSIGGWIGYKEILNEAKKVWEGQSSYKYTGTIYKYEHISDSKQVMAYIDTDRIQKTPTINLKFKKIDFNGSGVAGVGLEVNKGENVQKFTAGVSTWGNDVIEWNGVFSADGRIV